MQALSTRACGWSFVVCGAIAILLGQSALSAAPVSQPSTPSALGRVEPSTYCGVYAMYAALRLFHRQIDLAELVRPEYIASERGSTLAQLKQIADTKGLASAPVTNLTVSDLRRCGVAILHVKASHRSERYDHWVLYVGTRGQEAMILDSSKAPTEVSLTELSSKWDGTALVLGMSEVRTGYIMLPSVLRLGAVLTMWVSLTGLLRVVIGPRLASTSSLAGRGLHYIGQLAVLAIVGVAVAAAQFFVPGWGGLYRPAVDEIAARHAADFIPSVSLRRMKQLIDRAVVIDVRFPRDFSAGHVPTAINLPVDSSAADQDAVLADIPKNRQLVVYCQNKTCGYARYVARQLVLRGYADTYVYNGGWEEWRASVLQ